MRGFIDRIAEKVADTLMLFGATLWTGSWSSGSITVPDSALYLAYAIYQNNQWCIALRDETNNRIDGAWITGGSVYHQYSRVFRATVNGNIWTLSWAKEITHTASSNHSAGISQTVTKIVGLIPKVGGVLPNLYPLPVKGVAA